MNLTITPGHCHCGCGNPTLNGKRSFLQGHDAKLKSALIGAVVAGEDVVIEDGEVTRAFHPLRYAEQYGFTHMVAKAAERRQDKADRKAKRKPTAVPTPNEVAPIRPTVKAKVGRWEYCGTIQDGTFTYRDKRGEIQRTEKFAVAS